MDQFGDFEYSSSFEESLYGLLQSPQMEMQEKASPAEWSYDENKLFENALVEVDPTSPAFFENVAARIPWRSTEEIKAHYQALLNDVQTIELGNFPLPDYQTHHVDVPQKPVHEVMPMEAAPKKPHHDQPSSSNAPALALAKSKSSHPRRRGVPWTEDEHQLFLMGLNKYGKGDWRSISRFYVITKTPTQVASHAQKYFRRIASLTPVDRRRPSIHDIQTVNPNALNPLLPIPNFPSPMLHQGFINGAGGSQTLVDQNPMFPQHMNYTANFAGVVDPNQLQSAYGGAYGASSSYVLPPNMMNQQWG